MLCRARSPARLQDVAKVGLAGAVVNVSRGFARNYLIPQRLARAATPEASAAAKAAAAAGSVQQVRAVTSAEEETQQALEAIERLTTKPLVRIMHFCPRICFSLPAHIVRTETYFCSAFPLCMRALRRLCDER